MRLFDERLDSSGYRCYLAICFQVTARLVILDLRVGSNKQPVVHWRTQLSAVSIARVLCTRTFVYDLLVVRPDASTSLFTFAMMEVPLQFTSSISYRPSDVAKMPHSIVGVESFGDDAGAGATVTFVDKSQGKVNFNLALNAGLVAPIMVALSMTLPSEAFFHLLITYIVHRQRTSLSLHEKTDLMCFRHALADVFHLPSLVLAAPATMVLEDPWVQMQRSSKAWSRFEDDPALQHLDFTPPTMPVRPPANTTPPHPMLAPTLSTLHVWLEEQRLSLANEHAVMQVAPLICDIAMVIKPEWADHWKRLVPDAMATWHSPHRAGTYLFHVVEARPLNHHIRRSCDR
jgi:anaphase-promoting complex subunit 1